jgi:hypothetical protein
MTLPSDLDDRAAATASALTEAGTDVARAIADDIRLSAVPLPPVADRRG